MRRYCFRIATLGGVLLATLNGADVVTAVEPSSRIVIGDAESIPTPNTARAPNAPASTLQWHDNHWWNRQADGSWQWWDGQQWRVYGGVSPSRQTAEVQRPFSTRPRRFENGWNYPSGMNPSGGGWVGGFYSSGGGYGDSAFGYGYGVPSYGPWQGR